MSNHDTYVAGMVAGREDADARIRELESACELLGAEIRERRGSVRDEYDEDSPVGLAVAAVNASPTAARYVKGKEPQ